MEQEPDAQRIEHRPIPPLSRLTVKDRFDNT
jgi:hypothetical protein